MAAAVLVLALALVLELHWMSLLLVGGTIIDFLALAAGVTFVLVYRLAAKGFQRRIKT